MNERLELLKQQMVDLNTQVQDVYNQCDSEDRDPTDVEQTEIDNKLNEIEDLRKEVDRRERAMAQTMALAERFGKKSDDDASAPANNSTRVNVRDNARFEQVETNRGNHGFYSFGEFAKMVAKASLPGGRLDQRLIQNAPSTYGQEGVGADGGYAVPPDYRREIKQLVESEESLFSRTDMITTNSNRVELPVDETTDWQSSGGVLTYWKPEAGQLTQSKIALNSRSLDLHKLTVLVPVTEELLEDAAALDRYVRTKALSKIDFELTRVLVHGTGAGQPLGILNAPATISVAKESGQAADTLVFNNILNVWSRCKASYRKNAVWLANQDVEPQLMGLAFKDNAAGGPVYLPSGGFSASPFPTLMGRPVIYHEVAETVGDRGDLILADFSQYMTAVKTTGVRSDISMHLFFDYDMLAYRFIFRVAGQPWHSSAISPRDGSNTLSPFVTLAARA